MPLIASRRLAPLLVTQTLGAVNDNLFKNALVMLVLFQAASRSGPALVALAGGVFILPYVLFSATAGQVADRFEKRRLMVLVKSAEVVLMALAAWGFLTGSLPVLFGVLFGLGVQATFFGPIKYAVLPQYLPEGELLAGNGLIEAGTFAGILAGTVAGPLLFGMAHGAAVTSAVACAIAVAGLAAAACSPAAPPMGERPRIGWNVAAGTLALVQSARSNRPVWLCILALSWFWVVGATLLSELPSVARYGLGGDGSVLTVLLAAFSIGVGVGSVGCTRLLRGEASPRLVPFAALGVSLFLFDFAHAAASAHGLGTAGALASSRPGIRMLLDLAVAGACGGLYSVPLYAIIQESSATGTLARMIAADNVVNALAMALAAGATAGLAAVDASPTAILAWTAVANAFAAAWMVRMLPRETVRAIFRAYFRVVHGVTVKGLGNMPVAGTRTVVVVNHQSFLDGCLVAAYLPGGQAFAVDRTIATRWWAKPFLAAVRHITVDPLNPFSARTMVRAVEEGQDLIIFPEGRITVTGGLMKVYDGAGMVADKAGAVILPVRIEGARFTLLSRLAGRMPRRLRQRLSLEVMPPVAIEVDPALMGRARRKAVAARLQDVMEEAALSAADVDRTLFGALLDARGTFGPRAPIIEDTAMAPLGYGRIVLGSAILGRKLAATTAVAERVGVMLPNANGAVLAFMGLQAFGRVPAMLNFSAGSEAMLSACAAARVGTVVSSRAFVEKAKLGAVVARMEGAVSFTWLEDVKASIGLVAKLRGAWDARRARRLPGASSDPRSPAVVLFTSGSEGTPKGVVLSHRNILSNIAQVSAVVDFNASDRVFNAMPMFHSFGLTGATLLPLLSGVRSFLYPSPLHYRVVPELIYACRSTITFGTDTFLTGWARFAHPYDMRSVRYVFSGAERVREETRRLYADRFGVRILEGYGATETSPVLALNTPLHGRPGCAGRLVPGMDYRLEPVEGIGDGGRMSVSGPNVMLGYLRASDPGVIEPPPGGWYDTGDVCTVDAGRFVTIVARLKRFAKVAGEMVSMPAAEALAAGLWPDAQHAVVAVPDARKGEALVLLTTRADATGGALLAHARAAGAAEVAVPRTVRVMERLPLLGTGKVDYVTATREATEMRAAA